MRRSNGGVSQAESDGFRPARWAWTTLAGTILLGLLLFGVIVLGSDYSEAMAVRHDVTYRQFTPEVLRAFELGFAIALVPVILVAVATWRLRKGGTEIDERASAALGVLCVTVLTFGLVGALFHVPEAQGTRLTVETALSAIGAALLVASVWVRHVPRP